MISPQPSKWFQSGFASKVGRRAPTARYIKAQGKREARRPGYDTYPRSRPERPKYAGNYALSGLERLIVCYQGRRAPLRFALAPGSHISRRWRSVPTFEAKLRPDDNYSKVALTGQRSTAERQGSH